MMKMFSRLVLVFGFFYAGIAVGEASYGGWDSSNQQKSAFWRRYGDQSDKEIYCNDCLSTVVEIISRAANEREEGIDYFAQDDPCLYYPENKNRICSDVIGYVRDSGMLNIMESRKFCVNAKYCPPKYETQDDLPYSDNNDDDWSMRKSKSYYPSKPCGKKRNSQTDTKVDYNLQNGQELESETNLQLPNPAAVCNACENILGKIRRKIEEKGVFSASLPMLCMEVNSVDKSQCFKLMTEYGDRIIFMIFFGKKTNHAICMSLKQCTSYSRCRACQDYSNGLKDDNYIPPSVACSYLAKDEIKQCVKNIQDKSGEIIRQLYMAEDAFKVCRNLKFCPNSHLIGTLDQN